MKKFFELLKFRKLENVLEVWKKAYSENNGVKDVIGEIEGWYFGRIEHN